MNVIQIDQLGIIASFEGCSPCDCDPIGSQSSSSCDSITGQCVCHENVIGRRCDQCAEGTYSLNSSHVEATAAAARCVACDCDPKGVPAANRQTEKEKVISCDTGGNCGPCRANVTGQRCDSCLENHYKEIHADLNGDFYECPR